MSNLGAAEIKVVLENGKVKVYHSNGDLLFYKEATLNSWDNIWNTIRNAE